MHRIEIWRDGKNIASWDVSEGVSSAEIVSMIEFGLDKFATEVDRDAMVEVSK